MWRLSATRPADVDNLLVFSQLTVSGGNISAVSTPKGVTPPLARQTADAVAITGGTVNNVDCVGISRTAEFNLDNAGLSRFTGLVGIGTSPAAGYNLVVAPGKTIWQSPSFVGINVDPLYNLDVTGNVRITQRLGIADAPQNDRRLHITYLRASEHGIVFRPDADTGNYACMFLNGAQSFVGGISTSATTTTYSTSSDVRLKEQITALVGALDVVRALKPVSFTWQADGSPGVGFLAHELQGAVPEAVTGEAGAVHDDGSIRPQGVDQSKLVPWLTAAVQALAEQVQALTVRLEAAGA